MCEFIETHSCCHGRKLFCKYSLKGTPTVIFIAGLGDSCVSWNAIQNRISQMVSTLSYDRAGVGRSEAANVPRTCSDLVQEMAELITLLPVEPPYILVGHSFGGLVARLFASRYPLLVSGIILVDAAPEYKELAYEKVLPKELIAGNRAYLENPMANCEKIDKVQSYNQIAGSAWLNDIPLSIITRGMPDKSDKVGWPHEEILKIEQRLQGDVQLLSTVCRYRIAERSGHYVQHDEPEIVIEEITEMLKGWQF